MISFFDLFSIGIGPSSSHTVGPMRAAKRFAEDLSGVERRRAAALSVVLHGALAATGKGHGTVPAIVSGLCGADPESVEPAELRTRMSRLERTRDLLIIGCNTPVRFDLAVDVEYRWREVLEGHANALALTVLDDAGAVVRSRTWYSVGGGFIMEAGGAASPTAGDAAGPSIPFGFRTARELLDLSSSTGLEIWEIVLSNEVALRPEHEVRARVAHVWAAMQDCVVSGIRARGTLPGTLRVRKRAHELHARLTAGDRPGTAAPSDVDWMSMFAMAVNEENASGGRVVTAPTNGAAGIIPAVLHWYVRFTPTHDDDIVKFLLTATAIGVLFKVNASISGAEVGCQGEVGSACAMAAGGLAALLGGSANQIENAAEIGIEHNLGLTCDPVGGLVQIPCIERNAIAAVKAMTAARMALHGDGDHHVPLDTAIETMRVTGEDMSDKYKETSRGGLAVNVVEC